MVIEYEVKYKDKLMYSDDGWRDFEVWERISMNGDEVLFTQYVAYFEGYLFFSSIYDLVKNYERWADDYLNKVLLNDYTVPTDVVYDSAGFELCRHGSDAHPYNVYVDPIYSDDLEGIYTKMKTLISQLRELHESKGV